MAQRQEEEDARRKEEEERVSGIVNSISNINYIDYIVTPGEPLLSMIIILADLNSIS